MTQDQLLERLETIERDRQAHAELAVSLLMERDELIYEALKDTVAVRSGGPVGLAAGIARVLKVDRSWPYRIRDEFPERYKRWLIKRATDATDRPDAVVKAVERARDAAAAHLAEVDGRAAKEAAQKEKRLQRDRDRRARQRPPVAADQAAELGRDLTTLPPADTAEGGIGHP